MFAFANVVHLFADKFTSLCARRFSFALILFRTFNSLFFRHMASI